jgi:hypothetical protein
MTLPQCKWKHIIFTMPDAFWSIFKNYRYLLNRLAKIAADIVIKIAKEKGGAIHKISNYLI